MSTENVRENLSNPLPIMAAILIALGLVAPTVPLSSLRPQESERLKQLPAPSVPSRLWQDPLAAVELHREALGSATGTQAAVRTNIGNLKTDADRRLDSVQHKAPDSKPKLLILPVMLVASPFPEDAEARRRIRFAVESGLARQGFVPEDAESIRYVIWDRSQAGCKKTVPETQQTSTAAFVLTGTATPALEEEACASPGPVVVPHEWFRRRKDPGGAVNGAETGATSVNGEQIALVLWLREQDFYDHGLERLSELVGEIAPDERSRRIAVVGPATSTLYLALVKDLEKPSRLSQARFLSYGATIPEEEAVRQALARDERNPKPPEPIVRVIKGDDLLVAAVMRELGRRGVNRAAFAETERPGALEPCPDRIVLLVEGDYPYGRSLGHAFKQRVRQRCVDGDVRVFTYFRGLDGVLPNSSEREELGSSRRDDRKSKDVALDAPMEHAEGRNQYDYLHRIAYQIEQIKVEGGAERPLRAIGIFGSDVYDKLLVMQKLHSHLGRAIFFTTDLDARFLHRDQRAWTRNLVVASHFGFELHPTLQEGAAPFRDSYQTAAYLATIVAADPMSPAVERKVDQIKSAPRLFEIGRTRPGDLGASGKDGDCPSLVDCASFHPRSLLEVPHFASWKVLLAGALGLVLVLLTTHANRLVAAVVHIADYEGPQRKRLVRSIAAWTLAALAVLSTLTLVSVFVSHEIEAGEGEPFIWLEGVSAWPSHFLRFVALLVAIVLGAFAMRRLRMHAKAIAEDFSLQSVADGVKRRTWVPRPDPHSTMSSRWKRAVEWLRGPFVDFTRTERRERARTAETRVAVDRLWQRYQERTSGFNFWSWILLAMALLGAFASALYAIDPPFFGHRGLWVMRVNEILWVANVALLWATIFWTVYEARSCAYFIDRLSDTPSAWPAETLERQSRRTGLPKVCLVDYLDFRLILRAADRVNAIVYMPFVQIFLLGVAFHPFFDKVDIPWTLIAIAVVSLGYAIYAMAVLRRSAEHARNAVLKHYREALIWLAGGSGAPDPAGFIKGTEPGKAPTYVPLALDEINKRDRAAAGDQIRSLIERVNFTREGPFLPLLQQPLVKALLIPFGGWSGVSLIEPILNYFQL